MPTCEHCRSHDVRLFTPATYADRAAVLLCLDCLRLTIQPPRTGSLALIRGSGRAA